MRALEDMERLHYRDQLRAARYAALADAEGFGEICFALEALGLRLLGQQGDLGAYEERIGIHALKSPQFNELARKVPSRFKTFDALYRTVRVARNDAMHIGSYARHATEAAIELCIGLEEALMVDVKPTVGSVMVNSPVIVEDWHPVAHARQLMLMHSFSFLPVRLDGKWCLISELGLARFLNVGREMKVARLGLTIADAVNTGLEPVPIGDGQLLTTKMHVHDVLANARVKDGPMLWLVVDDSRSDRLAGVLSPFELM
jgi:CBS domain-containing protein